jgi:hypothetical protein
MGAETETNERPSASRLRNAPAGLVRAELRLRTTATYVLASGLRDHVT